MTQPILQRKGCYEFNEELFLESKNMRLVIRILEIISVCVLLASGLCVHYKTDNQYCWLSLQLSCSVALVTLLLVFVWAFFRINHVERIDMNSPINLSSV
jgi:hypothetical protein